MLYFHRIFLCAVVIILMITAGCTLSNTSNAPPLVTETQTAAATPESPVPTADGTIPPGAAGTQAAGTCTADTASDPANCGGCGYVCPVNALCQQGQCYCQEGYIAENGQCVVAPAGGTVTGNGCPAGMSPCPDGYCYELASSPDNCGICGNVCPAGMICSASTCTNVPTETTTVPATTTAVTTTVTSTSTLGPVGTGFIFTKCPVKGEVRCDGICVNLSTNNGNCGTCGNICSGLKPTCCNGTCTSLKTDESNCGTCGHKCSAWASCEAGSCKAVVAITTITYVPTVTMIVSIPPQYVNPVYQNPINPGI